MALIPITLDNTFDQWRTRTNQLITQAEQIEDKANAAFEKANAANLFAYNISIGANSYANLVGVSGNAYTNLIYTNAANYANLVGFYANSHANSVGVSSNAFARTVGQASNAYADFVGVSANAFARTVGDAANSRTNFVGASGNAYTNFVGGLANTNAANATYLSTGTVPSARMTGSYTGITGVGTLAAGTWQATPVGIQYGGTGGNTQETARSGLGLGSLATQNSVNGTQIIVGSDAQGDILYRGASAWQRLPAGVSRQVLTSSGASANPTWSDVITSGTARTVSTSEFFTDFTDIPSTAKRITLMFLHLAFTGTNNILVQIGNPTIGFLNSTYISGSQRYAATTIITSAAGFIIHNDTTGVLTLNKLNNSIWMASYSGMYVNGVIGTQPTSMTHASGWAPNGGSIDVNSIRIIRSGTTGTFESGTINFYYE